MRVLMTADAVGGVWTYALELCAALAAQDVEVVLATMGPAPTKEQRNQLRHHPHVRLAVSDYKLEWMQEPWTDVSRAGEWLLRLAADVDLVHLNGYAHAPLAWRKPVIVVAHSCVYSWWNAVYGDSPPSLWQRYREIVEQGLNAADRIVAPTRAFLSMLNRHYCLQTKCHVIPNGISRVEGREQNSVAKEPFVFANGRLWDQAKNMRVLDEVAGELPWPVYAAGDLESPDGQHVQPKQMQALGRRSASEISSWLQRASIFAHPACYEPFGLSVLEAAYAGCALVLADIHTLRELWQDAAIFVKAADSEQWQERLSSLIADSSLRESMSRRAYLRSLQFTASSMAAEYTTLYRELLRESLSERSVA